MKNSLQENERPFYLQIRDKLLQEIKGKDEYRLPSENQLCRTYGVSRPTVRRALEYLTRQKLVVRKKGKGTFVRKPQEARPQVMANHGIAVTFQGDWPAEIRSFYIGDVMDGILRASQKANRDLKILNCLHMDIMDRMKDLSGYPLLWISPNTEQMRTIEDLERLGHAVVILNRRCQHSGVSYVTCDHTRGGYLATEHLLSYGHQKIAFVINPNGLSHLEERYKGFLMAHRKHRVTPETYWDIDIHLPEEEIRKAVRARLQGSSRPTALFVCGGIFQYPVLEGMRDMNLKIPEDISIVAYDNVMGISAENSLTVITQPLREMGQLAVEKIIQGEKEGNRERFTVVLPPTLIQRNSVKRL